MQVDRHRTDSSGTRRQSRRAVRTLVRAKPTRSRSSSASRSGQGTCLAVDHRQVLGASSRCPPAPARAVWLPGCQSPVRRHVQRSARPTPAIRPSTPTPLLHEQRPVTRDRSAVQPMGAGSKLASICSSAAWSGPMNRGASGAASSIAMSWLPIPMAGGRWVLRTMSLSKACMARTLSA